MLGSFGVCEGSFQFAWKALYVKAPPADRCSVVLFGLLEQLEDLLTGSTRFAYTLR